MNKHTRVRVVILGPDREFQDFAALLRGAKIIEQHENSPEKLVLDLIPPRELVALEDQVEWARKAAALGKEYNLLAEPAPPWRGDRSR